MISSAWLALMARAFQGDAGGWLTPGIAVAVLPPIVIAAVGYGILKGRIEDGKEFRDSVAARFRSLEEIVREARIENGRRHDDINEQLATIREQLAELRGPRIRPPRGRS